MEVKNIKFEYQNKPLINNLSISFKKHKITSIIGPNGSGKSALLILLSRIYKASEGKIILDNKNIWDYRNKDFAKKVAVVHQKNIQGDLDVKIIVGYGRLPCLNYHQSLSGDDYKIIEHVLEITKLKEYAHIPLINLSGG